MLQFTFYTEYISTKSTAPWSCIAITLQVAVKGFKYEVKQIIW